MKTTKEIGNKLEELVVSFIRKIDLRARRTKNSGGSTELEDVLSKFFMVQCKVDNVHNNIIIKMEDWNKLFKNLPIDSTRIPIFVNQQKTGIVTVTLLISDYFRTITKLFEATGDIQ
jgi:hypothetical protein